MLVWVTGDLKAHCHSWKNGMAHRSNLKFYRENNTSCNVPAVLVSDHNPWRTIVHYFGQIWRTSEMIILRNWSAGTSQRAYSGHWLITLTSNVTINNPRVTDIALTPLKQILWLKKIAVLIQSRYKTCWMTKIHWHFRLVHDVLREDSNVTWKLHNNALYKGYIYMYIFIYSNIPVKRGTCGFVSIKEHSLAVLTKRF